MKWRNSPSSLHIVDINRNIFLITSFNLIHITKLPTLFEIFTNRFSKCHFYCYLSLICIINVLFLMSYRDYIFTYFIKRFRKSGFEMDDLIFCFFHKIFRSSFLLEKKPKIYLAEISSWQRGLSYKKRQPTLETETLALRGSTKHRDVHTFNLKGNDTNVIMSQM